MQDVPYGFCHCGCGERTRVATSTSRRDGQIKGQPLRYILGHHQRRPLAQRFWAHVDRDGPLTPHMDTPCWIWTGALTGGYGDSPGYGYFRHEGRSLRAHRVAYELEIGPIPPGKVLDHLCRNHQCVRPSHTEPVTQAENIMRGRGHIAAQMRAQRAHDATP